jgi:hypothetical protein
MAPYAGSYDSAMDVGLYIFSWALVLLEEGVESLLDIELRKMSGCAKTGREDEPNSRVKTNDE